MKNDEIIAVVRAHEDGKTIQCRISNSTQTWLDAPHPLWDFFGYDYRIKPEPPKAREFWIGVHPELPISGDGYQSCVTTYPAKPIGCSGHLVHVREVLDQA